jgi:hypothetical protein
VHETAFLHQQNFLCSTTASLQSVARRIRMYPRDSTSDFPMFDPVGGAFIHKDQGVFRIRVDTGMAVERV